MANTVPADKRELIGAFLEAMASESYKAVLKGMEKMTKTKIATLNKGLDNATGE